MLMSTHVMKKGETFVLVVYNGVDAQSSPSPRSRSILLFFSPLNPTPRWFLVVAAIFLQLTRSHPPCLFLLLLLLVTNSLHFAQLQSAGPSHSPSLSASLLAA